MSVELQADDKRTLLHADLVKRLAGASRALVWARIEFRTTSKSPIAHDAGGDRWWTATLEDLAEETGLTVKQARAAVEALVKAGDVVREHHFRRGGYDRTYSYRSVDRSICPNGQMDLPKQANGSARSGESNCPNGQINLPKQANVSSIKKVKKVEEGVEPTTSSARGTRIPDPFEITSDMRQWAAQKTPAVDVDRATEKFVNHFTAKSGRDASKRDWRATWRNWLLTDQERAEQRHPQKQTPEDRMRATLALVTDLKEIS